ncbi:hypothetical protein FOA52_002999 [Chlamydomonas sp. UWO 241]|nr:hypothetical protein FOA52_002999 [Chlamydomonas sp. UWO 241]
MPRSDKDALGKAVAAAFSSEVGDERSATQAAAGGMAAGQATSASAAAPVDAVQAAATQPSGAAGLSSGSRASRTRGGVKHRAKKERAAANASGAAAPPAAASTSGAATQPAQQTRVPPAPRLPLVFPLGARPALAPPPALTSNPVPGAWLRDVSFSPVPAAPVRALPARTAPAAAAPAAAPSVEGTQWGQRQTQGRSGGGLSVGSTALDPQAEAIRWLALMQADQISAQTQRPLAGDGLVRVLMEMLLLAKMQQPRRDEECVVCMERPRSVTLTPCRHRAMCAACCADVCATSGELREDGAGEGCPVCRERIQRTYEA